jgi:hypothetical protein
MAETNTAPSPSRRKAPSKAAQGRAPKAAGGSASPKAADRTLPPRSSAQEGEDQGLTIRLPMMTVQLHRPHVPRMIPHDVDEAVDTVQSTLPPVERLTYYAGLGALAALGIIEWPVAAAIGVGTMLAKRALKREAPAEHEHEGGRERAGAGEIPPRRKAARAS